jgi:hypothetical protein
VAGRGPSPYEIIDIERITTSPTPVPGKEGRPNSDLGRAAMLTAKRPIDK